MHQLFKAKLEQQRFRGLGSQFVDAFLQYGDFVRILRIIDRI